MQVIIQDLEEFSNKKAVFVKLGNYKINVNDIPLKTALKVNEYFKSIQNGDDIDTQMLIDDIVIPLIIRQNPDSDKEKISEDFNYDQLLKLMNMIFESYLHAGSDSKETKENDAEDKKKE